MPRPPDTYTHAQFTTVESDTTNDTVQCVHCKQWTGSNRTLHRKKEHLQRCPAYAAWRAAGNGQELQPQNRYSKRDVSLVDDSPQAHTSESGFSGFRTVAPPRLTTADVTAAFVEFWDDDASQKCLRTRCVHCGNVRAKNASRQYEHLQNCKEFLNSAEGQRIRNSNRAIVASSQPTGDIWRGNAPNPNLQFSRPRPSLDSQRITRPLVPTASLAGHLLSRLRTAVEEASQQPFLSHAGCGTLSRAALQQWIWHQGHMSRSFTTFLGCSIGKMRLSDTFSPQTDTNYRTFDLLVSALNNSKRELDFLRSTQQKFALITDQEPPRPATKGMMDLFANASSSAASLLESTVILWAVQHLHNMSWQYAGNFYNPPAPAAPSTAYSLPSYLQSGQPETGRAPPQTENAHIKALHEVFIPNWTSAGFRQFVEACHAIVDELANSQTKGSGAAELSNCETTFRQLCWLWKQAWPEVTGMGEHIDTASLGPSSIVPPGAGALRANGGAGGGVVRGSKNAPIAIRDADGDAEGGNDVSDDDALGADEEDDEGANDNHNDGNLRAGQY